MTYVRAHAAPGAGLQKREGPCEGGLWTGGPATHWRDGRRAAFWTPVEPQTRYGADGPGPRAALFAAPSGGAAAPSGQGLLGHSSVPPTGRARSASEPLLVHCPNPGPGSAALAGHRPWSTPLILLVLGLPVSGARQVLHRPAQLRRTDAYYHFLADSCHPSCPRGMASLWPAPSSLSSPRSPKVHLWWRPVGSCPGALGTRLDWRLRTQIVAWPC